jgi:hypothetical protein
MFLVYLYMYYYADMVHLHNNCEVHSCFQSIHGYICTCICSLGWIGHTCNDKDYCVSTPCHNNGHCTNIGSKYKCMCTLGWTGTNCTIRDYCYNNPCKHHGRCVNKNSSEFPLFAQVALFLQGWLAQWSTVIQVVPIHPDWQLHEKLLFLLTHLPWCLQGLL